MCGGADDGKLFVRNLAAVREPPRLADRRWQRDGAITTVSSGRPT
jgi:hypothetical protein